MSSGGGGDRHETLILRLEIGHESVLLVDLATLHKVTPNAHTHRWTVFVRGQNEASLSPLIQKVVFQLHDSFPNPKRIVSSPPFEVSETGYGGFVIPIFIVFAHSKKDEQHYIEYDMNLPYVENFKNKETKMIEFKDPKPELRARLLKAGAEIVSSKTTKAQPGGSSFQDLFGETLHLTSPSTSNEKPKLSAPVPNVKRQSASPSSNGSSVKAKHLSIGKPSKGNFSAAIAISQVPSPQESEKKRRKSKDSTGRSSSNKSSGKHASYANFDADNHRSVDSRSAETNGAAQCLLDAPKIPPFVSPLSDGAYGAGSIYPSTSSATRDDQRSDDADSEQYKLKKLSNKFRQKGADKLTGNFSTARNAKRHVQNGGVMEDKGKRKKTKSDSGLDSDYSSGMPNAHSPGVANGQHSVGVHEPQGGGNALFSPPDSVRSLDTLQESPASAASSSSGGSSSSSTSRPRRHNGCDDDLVAAGSSSTSAITDQVRIRQLMLLQQKIMTIKEKRVAQRVVDVISTQSSFELTPDCLEFDLCTLDSDLIQRLLQIFDLQV